MNDVYDYIVIGGGSSGAVVASRLAAADASVLLLEAGGTDKRLAVKVPGAVSSVYQVANWKYPVEPDPSRTNSPEAWKAGKILGGGGSINSCVYVRGNKSDYDDWARMGGDGWSYDEVLPSFKRLESWEGGASPYRGGDGPIGVMVQRDRGIANTAYCKAAQQAGYRLNEDYNGASQDGVGFVQVNHRRGWRSQASMEYLKRIAPSSRITVKTDAHATRILFEGKQAIGVEYLHEGQMKQSRVREEVILSAGAIGSPKLLKLSGVGPRAELESFGIAVVADVPGVGANLHDHAMVLQCWHAKQGVPTFNTMTRATMMKGMAEYLFRGTGFLAMTVVPVQVMAKTEPSLESPNLQLIFAPFSISRHRDPSGMFDVKLTKEAGFFSSSIFLHPRARGTVSLRSNSPMDPPLIKHRFFEDLDDLRDSVTGMREVQRIMSQSAMKEVSNGQMELDKLPTSDADWERYVRNMSSSASHAVGTCKMGSDDMAVVDSRLRVRGTTGLRVVDASIMPKITTGNTNAPAMMIGEHAARFILNERQA